MEIKLSKKEMVFLLYSLRGYRVRMSINIQQDRFFENLFKKHMDIRKDDLGRIERRLYKKVLRKIGGD